MVIAAMKTADEIKKILSSIPDPEIPVITISELGIIRDVTVDGEKVHVSITPTYSGCPATKVIEEEIRESLRGAGCTDITVKTVISPAWTTDWISEEAKEKLRKYGIAPPGKRNGINNISGDRNPECPACGSDDVSLVSFFGSTPCKAIYKCNSCLEPFDQFKCH